MLHTGVIAVDRVLGLGISFLPRNGVSQELGNGTLTITPIRGVAPIYLPTCALVRQAQHYSPTVLAFLELLQETYGADISLLREVGSR